MTQGHVLGDSCTLGSYKAEVGCIGFWGHIEENPGHAVLRGRKANAEEVKLELRFKLQVEIKGDWKCQMIISSRENMHSG